MCDMVCLSSNGCFCLRVENRTSVLHLFMSFMGLTVWGGVGWGGIITLLALPHIYDATLLCGVGWGGVG